VLEGLAASVASQPRNEPLEHASGSIPNFENMEPGSMVCLLATGDNHHASPTVLLTADQSIHY
jgi:hypothetical protein